MNVQNVDLCSIDEHNVDEVIELELEAPNEKRRYNSFSLSKTIL